MRPRQMMARANAFFTADLGTGFFRRCDAAMELWPVPYQASDVRSSFGTTRVYTCGPGEGRPLILLHGRGFTSAGWFANVAALSARHRVYAVDTIGEPGRSRNDGELVISREAFMDWLDTLLTRLGLDTADVCGHAFGGWLALNFALHAPGRVRRLVLLDPVQCVIKVSSSYARHAGPAAWPTEDQMRSFFAWQAAGRAIEPALLDVLTEGMTGFPVTRAVYPRRPADRRLRTLATPTLVLMAGRSVVHDAAQGADRARKLLPHGTAAVVEDASHNLPMDEPDAVTERVLEFLDAD